MMKVVDFIAAGQNRPAATVFFTLLATMLGASATLGVAESAEKIGFPAVWWLLCGSVGLVLQGVLLSGRIRETGAKTLPELARIKVGPAAQRLVAAVIVLAWPAVVGAQFSACAGLFEAFVGTGARTVVVLVSAAIVVLYTLVGGQRAVVRTDSWELLILAVGFGGLFLWVFTGQCGGEPPPAGSIRLFSNAFGPCDLALMLPTVVGPYFLGPDIASRSIVARDGRAARRAVLWSAPALAAFGGLVALSGMWAEANAPGAGNPVLRIAMLLPAPLRWCIAAGLFCALLSTADTCLVNAAAILSNDLLGRRGVKSARISVAVVGVAAMALALFGGDIIGILLSAYSIYVPGVVCPLAVAILSRRVHAGVWLAAVAAGGICGLATAVIPCLSALPAVGMGISLALALLSAWKANPVGANTVLL